MTDPMMQDNGGYFSKPMMATDQQPTSPDPQQKNKGNNVSKKRKPKRNRSAFIIFSSEMRAKIKAEASPQLNSNEMMVKLASLWKDLADDEKKKYHDEAEKEKMRYLMELNEFYQKNPFEVIQNKTKKNHVKKPCSAYALYLKEQKKEIKKENPNLKMADVLKLVAQKWKNIDDDVRSIYQEKAQTEKEITWAKLNEHIKETEDSKSRKVSQQTRKSINNSSYNQKRGFQESKDSVKQEDEPGLSKHQMTTNTSLNNRNSQFMDQGADINFNNLSELFNSTLLKLPSNTDSFLMKKMSSKDDMKFNKEQSQLWGLYDSNALMSKKSSEFMIDLLNFPSMKGNGGDQQNLFDKRDDFNKGQMNMSQQQQQQNMNSFSMNNGPSLHLGNNHQMNQHNNHNMHNQQGNNNQSLQQGNTSRQNFAVPSDSNRMNMMDQNKQMNRGDMKQNNNHGNSNNGGGQNPNDSQGRNRASQMNNALMNALPGDMNFENIPFDPKME